MEGDDDRETAAFGVDGYSPEESGAAQGMGGYLETQAERTQVIAINGGMLC